MLRWVKAARELRRATDKIGNTVGVHPITRREYNLAIKALHEISDNMPPDQQERRIMATINGTKVLIVVIREMPRAIDPAKEEMANAIAERCGYRETKDEKARKEFRELMNRLPGTPSKTREA